MAITAKKERKGNEERGKNKRTRELNDYWFVTSYKLCMSYQDEMQKQERKKKWNREKKKEPNENQKLR